MKRKLIFILLPDGVGLRNFAFTSFVNMGKQLGWDVIFWNQTSFDLSALGFREIKLSGKPRTLTDLLKRSKIEAELNLFEEKFDDPIYQSYKFPQSHEKIKFRIKNKMVSFLSKRFSGEKGTLQLRKKIKDSERKGGFYRRCKEVLKKEKPDYIFCTNQRPVNAIAPLTAAQDLGIKTGTFIFSWDNLPKATMVVEPDHYFVWSDYMKKELLTYYPYINPDKVHVTGSPQFEPHFDPKLKKQREEFFRENGLDEQRRYICFSGDDVTTSPDDPQYLDDVAHAVETLNSQNYNLGIIFRRSPVDFSNRYDEVLEKHKKIIIPLEPKWNKSGEAWNSILPTEEDLRLQINTILHTEAVVNLGSSMIFDYVAFDKPCLYFNYDVKIKKDESWSVRKIYKFVHFRSMPSNKAVTWLNSKEEISKKLKVALSASPQGLKETKDWFQKINMHPPQEASQRVWQYIHRSSSHSVINNEQTK